MGILTTLLMNQHNHFYLSDFHSRDEVGSSVVEGSISVVKVFSLNGSSEIYSSLLFGTSNFGLVIFSVEVSIC